MQDLVGKSFTVGDGEYRVVDVRRMNGDSMVYAEATKRSVQSPRQPQRMAFHYGDIANLLTTADNNIA
jgi:hypothetical protein